MSLLLIAELPLFSLKFKHFKWRGNEIKFVFLGISLVLILLLLAWSIPIIVTLYLILSVIENKRKKYAA
jgi:CDP-diacylglycerol---serine O-phosphatidyltransferase